MKKLYSLFGMIIMMGLQPALAQVSIVSASVNAFNITPQSLCQVGIMNAGTEVNAVLEARITNSSGQSLLAVVSTPFRVGPGMNMISGSNIQLSNVQFGSSAQGQHLQSTHVLPSGLYNYCCYIRPLTAAEPTDEYCQDIESDLSSFLQLVSPFDHDTIQEQYPVLLWTHSEAFNLLGPDEHFRIVIVELSEGQSAEAGVTANIPIYMKDFLTAHQLQYPVDAKNLEKGKRYGWQVQKLTHQVITNKTDAWEFIIAPPHEIKENKYAALKKKADGGFYTAENNKLYFRFDEAYTDGVMSCKIYDDKRQLVLPKTKNEDSSKSQGINVKTGGYNRFEINLDEMDIKPGYHTLEVKNSKGELYILKFYVIP